MYEPDQYGYDDYSSRAQSAVGIASLLISLAGVAVMAAAIGWAMYAAVNNPGHFDRKKDDSPELMLMGLTVLASIGAEVVALVLGIVAISQPDRSKTTAALGLIVSGGSLIVLGGLVLIGLAAG